MTVKKAAIFDVDGTLTDTEKVTVYALKKTMKDLFDKDYKYDELKFAFIHTGKDALRKLGVEDVDSTFEVWSKNIVDMYHEVTIYPGICELLKNLKENDRKLGIVTSRYQFEIEIDNILKNILHYFDVVVPNSEGLRPKPYPDQLILALDNLGIKPEEAVYVGDSKFDYECAKNCGVDFVLANWGESDRRDDIPADDMIVCENPDELIKYI
jgi:phosphoglycolate phosphatase-like HAD superfamily hydrolase